MQKGSHLVCGMFMLVGAEKKYGLEERHVGPRQERVVNAGHAYPWSYATGQMSQNILKICPIWGQSNPI